MFPAGAAGLPAAATPVCDSRRAAQPACGDKRSAEEAALPPYQQADMPSCSAMLAGVCRGVCGEEGGSCCIP